MRKFVGVVIYYLLNILLLPITVLGYGIWVFRLLAERGSGVSATAQGPLSARWVQHQLGVRQDQAAGKLMMALPSVSPWAVWMVFAPTLLAHRLIGYVPPTFRYPFRGEMTLQNQASARQSVYDAVVDQYVEQVEQFVILGAGFDTRALRLPNKEKIRSFELDTPKTLALKQALLHKAHIESANVAFVEADFAQQDWLLRLQEAGFNANERTLFVWEGVTPYLEKSVVEDTLRKVSSTGTGSVIAFDYFTSEVLESGSLYLRIVRASLSAGGEALKFVVDSTPPVRVQIAALLGSCGLTLAQNVTLGQESNGKRALGGFAIAIVI